MNWQSPRAGRRLRVESLEAKLPMAGNVTADLTANDLTITGDGEANILTIVEDGGAVTVTGVDGTTINGLEMVEFPAADVNNAVIDLGAGDDKITIERLEADNDLTVNTGEGADTANIKRGTSVGNALQVNTAQNNDKLRIRNSTVNGDVLIETRAGADQLTMRNVEIGMLSADTGPGDDTVELRSVDATTDFFLDTGLGDDAIYVRRLTAEEVGIRSRAGDDTVMVKRSAFQADVAIETADGDDSVEMRFVTADQDLTADGGNAEDSIFGRDVNVAGVLEVIDFEEEDIA